MIFEEKDYEIAGELLKKLTLEEKISMIHGAGLFETAEVRRLGIPALKMSDGPMGVRREFEKDSWNPAGNNDDFVTYLPCNSAVAATWNRELAYVCGKVLGEEARGRGKDIILAPGMNIKRSPLCGRNFEYLSEDPYLTGNQAASLVKGVQESDVAACIKHFALNNQERNRLWVDTEVEERALREIYLPAFRMALEKGKALTLMGAYNLVRGSRCCENKYLLDEILRGEWKWDGVTISDWGGILRTKESAEVSMDMEMSIYSNFDEYYFAKPLYEAVQNGEISEKVIDEKVYRVLCLMSALHMLDGKRKQGAYNTKEHQTAALQIAEESVVLLKNEKKTLPLHKEKVKKLLVIGDNAVRQHSLGGGSAEIKALYEIVPLMGIKQQLGGETEVKWTPGYYVPEDNEQEGNWQENSLMEREGKTAGEEIVSEKVQEKREQMMKEAIALAKEYEKVVFVGGLNHWHDLEDQDRRDMKLPYGQDELIEKLLAVNPNMVIVMMAGSPVEMHRWEKSAKAIVWQWYAGMEGGRALAEVLFGDINPSGKLPETFPIKHTDCSAHCVGEFGKKDIVRYRENIFVGYRYYEKENVPVQYPFGHGLSYTDFSYGACSVKVHGSENGKYIEIEVPLKNIGDCTGKETVQLYISKNNSSVSRPVKELKGYQKVELNAQEEKIVQFTLTDEELSYFDENTNRMEVEKGSYLIQLGASVADIRSVAEIEL